VTCCAFHVECKDECQVKSPARRTLFVDNDNAKFSNNGSEDMMDAVHRNFCSALNIGTVIAIGEVPTTVHHDAKTNEKATNPNSG